MTLSQDESNGAVRSEGQEAAVRNNLKELNIHLRRYLPGQYVNLLCPHCGGGRSKEQSLALLITENGCFATWLCFRAKCGWSGSTQAGASQSYQKNKYKKEREETVRELSEEGLKLQPLAEQQIEFLASRGISTETLLRNGVKGIIQNGENILAFPYWEDGKIVSCKYRTLDKRFWQEKNTRKIFYGLDDIKDADEIIIVEGELDKLAMEEAGIQNCISVPDGAPSKVAEKGVPPETEDKKYEYIWNCKNYFAKATRIVLATDSDPPGQALAEEIARRLGRERCWRVKWPTWGDQVCKDANQVLEVHGKEALQNMIANAELYPIRGLFRFSDFGKEIDDYYHQSFGDELGVSTGWKGLDQHYRVVPGELTVVTGVPSSGKSEWIDALLCNLNSAKGWSFALCSMENQVREHGRKLLEKRIGKPFFNAPYSGSVPRMTKQDFEEGKAWLNRTFYLIRCNNDQLPSVQWLLDVAKSAVMRYGIRGLVIDPYNELDHQRPPNMTETEYVSQILTKIKRFAQHHDCHVWFVAHPKQLQGWRGDAPSLYDISGSAHFINKCDIGIIVHRNRDPDKGPADRVQIHVRKVRNKAAGTIGDAFLTYDRVTGVYKDCVDF